MSKGEVFGIILLTLFFLAVMGSGAAYFLMNQSGSTLSPADQEEVEYQLQVATFHVQSRQFSEAIRVYDKVIEIAPDDPRAYAGRAYAYQSKGQRDWAIRDYDRAVDLGAQDEAVYTNRAALEMSLGNLEAALEDCHTAIELNENSIEAHQRAASILYQLARYEESIPHFTRVIELDATASVQYRDRGWAHDAIGNSEEAYDDFSQVIAISRSKHSHFARGVSSVHARRHDRAEDDLIEACELSPGDQDYPQLYRWVNDALHGDRETADERLREFIRTSRLAPWTKQIAAFLLGDLDETAFLDNTPGPNQYTDSERDCEAYYYAGMVRLLNQDLEGAAAHFQKSLDTGELNFYEHHSGIHELRRLRERGVAPEAADSDDAE